MPRVASKAMSYHYLLSLLLGGQAPVLRQFANGIDERPLIPAREPQKSFSQQETFDEDVTDEEYVEAVLRRMADRLFATVREEGRSVRTLTVKVRYNDRDENQRAESLSEPTDLETDVYGRLRGLLCEAWQRRVSLRMVSLKLSNVYAPRSVKSNVLSLSLSRKTPTPVVGQKSNGKYQMNLVHRLSIFCSVVLVASTGCTSPEQRMQTQVNETGAKHPATQKEVRWSTTNPNVGIAVAMDAPADVTPNNFQSVETYWEHGGKVLKITTLPGHALHDAGTRVSEIVSFEPNVRRVGVEGEYGFEWEFLDR